MNIFTCLWHAGHPANELPPFIRAIDEIRGVRVIRLHGPVGNEIGAQVMAADDSAGRSGQVYTRPTLMDFTKTTNCDFSTVSYLVQAISRRMASGTKVGIINAPRELLAEFEIARLGSLFNVFSSEDEAIRSLAAPATGTTRM